MTQPNHYREVLAEDHLGQCRAAERALSASGTSSGSATGSSTPTSRSCSPPRPAATTASTRDAPSTATRRMPFRERAVVELVNESRELHRQYFYVDYEQDASSPPEDAGYFHAEFRRENPFGGWSHDILVNHPEADVGQQGAHRLGEQLRHPRHRGPRPLHRPATSVSPTSRGPGGGRGTT